MSRKENTDARLHTSRNDPDRGAAESSGARWCPYTKGAPSSSCTCAAKCYYEAGEKAEREAAARHESVDGLHSREAR
jgi:hypothetical protein